jgi:hypothetical protein
MSDYVLGTDTRMAVIRVHTFFKSGLLDTVLCVYGGGGGWIPVYW